MNKLIAVSLMFITVNASALSERSSWSEIFADNSSRYSHGQSAGLGGLSLSNVCLTDTEVKSVKPVTVCTKWQEVAVNEEGGVRYEQVCVRKGTQSITLSRTYNSLVCNEYSDVNEDESGARSECVGFDRVQTKVPNRILVNVWQDLGESSTFPGFDKEFTFPTCK